MKVLGQGLLQFDNYLSQNTFTDLSFIELMRIDCVPATWIFSKAVPRTLSAFLEYFKRLSLQLENLSVKGYSSQPVSLGSLFEPKGFVTACRQKAAIKLGVDSANISPYVSFSRTTGQDEYDTPLANVELFGANIVNDKMISCDSHTKFPLAYLNWEQNNDSDSLLLPVFTGRNRQVHLFLQSLRATDQADFILKSTSIIV